MWKHQSFHTGRPWGSQGTQHNIIKRCHSRLRGGRNWVCFNTELFPPLSKLALFSLCLQDCPMLCLIRRGQFWEDQANDQQNWKTSSSQENQVHDPHTHAMTEKRGMGDSHSTWTWLLSQQVLLQPSENCGFAYNQVTINQDNPTQKAYENIWEISFPKLSILWLINHEPIYLKLYGLPPLEMLMLRKRWRYEGLSHQLTSLKESFALVQLAWNSHLIII